MSYSEQNPARDALRQIEELLNGFIDGELTPAQLAQVQQLISENPQVARRLKDIERCRLLVSSLPPAEPPAEVVQGIKQLIRTHTSGVKIESRQGARYLFVRKVLAASIMVGLLGVLAAVIFKITGPADIKSPVAVEVRPANPATAAADDGIGVYSLRLQTADFTGVDAFVKKLLDESTWLRYEAKKVTPGQQSTYRVLCSRGALEALMSDLAAVWSKFDSQTLVIHTADAGRYAAVEEIQPEQIVDIAGRDAVDERVRLARDFAVLNGVRKIMPERTMLALTDGQEPQLPAIPKPVLTSGQKGFAAAPKGAADQVRVDLNIIVTGHK